MHTNALYAWEGKVVLSRTFFCNGQLRYCSRNVFFFIIVNNNKELRVRNKLLVYFGIILGLFETIDSSSDSSYERIERIESLKEFEVFYLNKILRNVVEKFGQLKY